MYRLCRASNQGLADLKSKFHCARVRVILDYDIFDWHNCQYTSLSGKKSAIGLQYASALLRLAHDQVPAGWQNSCQTVVLESCHVCGINGDQKGNSRPDVIDSVRK